MPLHLNSITNDTRNSKPLAWILQKGIDACDSIFITDDHKYIHTRSIIVDRLSKEPIGRIVYTILIREDSLEVKDVDIVWNNEAPTALRFNEIKNGSSDANEYYEVETVDEEQHLEVETVNRHVIPDNIINTVRNVFISAFPFELSVFADIDEFNKWAGFCDGISVGNTDLTVHGFSEKFTMPGGVLGGEKEDDESYSFIIGKILSYKDVEVAFGETVYSFIIARADTALGVIPVSMSKEVFDLDKLKNGCIIAMKADVKADLARDEDFKYNNDKK